ncbi:universal stress protein [Kribbella sp. NPDC051952]|uniref:universal stress protein n=1 Tax=Kribbella sp. NPDC051952 TaxID=3154851 RepID=UPI00343027C3
MTSTTRSPETAPAATGPVVVEVDGSAEGLRVIDYACTEAVRDDAELVLLAAHQASDVAAGEERQPSAERARESLRVAVAHTRRQIGDALEVTVICESGSRIKVLSAAADGARALVIGRSRHRGPERLIAARSNLLLARRSDCPLIVVPGSWKAAPSQRDVAVGVDGTALSSEAVGYAFGAAGARGGNLVAVHAAPRHSLPDGLWIRTAESALAEMLGRWSSEYPEVKVTRYLTCRPVVAALLHKSREVSLVVLGAHAGIVPIGDPIARRAMAVVSGPVAIVPHRAAHGNQHTEPRSVEDLVTTVN